jgi:hypothetical protein
MRNILHKTAVGIPKKKESKCNLKVCLGSLRWVFMCDSSFMD